jgi:hypothetical protein
MRVFDTRSLLLLQRSISRSLLTLEVRAAERVCEYLILGLFCSLIGLFIGLFDNCTYLRADAPSGIAGVAGMSLTSGVANVLPLCCYRCC